MIVAGYFLAIVRAILIFSGMLLYMLAYGFVTLFYRHDLHKALQLRRHYLKYVCLPVLNIRIEIKGAPVPYPALYVSNHRSFADPIALCRYIDAFVLAKAEVRHYPIINWGAELTGVIWVNREDQQSRDVARNAVVQTIRSGVNVLVFPEGTVSTEKGILPLKKGSFMEAAHHRLPVVPIALEFRSPRDMWVIHSFVPQYLYQFSKWRTEVKIHIGTPLTGESGDDLHREATAWVSTTLAGMQSNWSRAFPS